MWLEKSKRKKKSAIGKLNEGFKKINALIPLFNHIVGRYQKVKKKRLMILLELLLDDVYLQERPRAGQERGNHLYRRLAPSQSRMKPFHWRLHQDEIEFDFLQNVWLRSQSKLMDSVSQMAALQCLCETCLITISWPLFIVSQMIFTLKNGFLGACDHDSTNCYKTALLLPLNRMNTEKN